MKQTPEQMALQQSLVLCQGHADALQEALQDIHARDMDLDGFTNLSKQDRRLLDQFAYRYTRLQDDMGAKLMPAVLKALGEDVAPMSALDRFFRLEQLGWLALMIGKVSAKSATSSHMTTRTIPLSVFSAGKPPCMLLHSSHLCLCAFKAKSNHNFLFN
jgi:hypothetical protein